MRILIVTDAFPPVCGGSGWSTYELARGLQAAGHHVLVVRPRPGAPPRVTLAEYGGFQVREMSVLAPNVPYLRNYLKSERLTRVVAPELAAIVEREQIDVVHGQHVMSSPPAAVAAHRTGRPFVCTVRDYWPVCYWSTLLVSALDDELCPACTPPQMRRCTRARAGAGWPFAWPLLPYMRANLRRKAETLSGADAIVAVSTVLARDLSVRCPGLDARRVHTIPNPVDVAGLRQSVASAPPPPLEPYALFVGKLASNKGVDRLFDAVERAQLRLPLVVVGDGPERRALEARAQTTSVRTAFTGWLDRPATLAWMKHARFLIFPSRGPESLSRVLLESSALGVPAAAMHTGGTADIIIGGRTGLLSSDADGLARDIARLEADSTLCAGLGEAAARHVSETFDAPQVVRRMVEVYQRVCDERRQMIGAERA